MKYLLLAASKFNLNSIFNAYTIVMNVNSRGTYLIHAIFL